MDLGLRLEKLKCYSCVLDTVTRREETQESIVSDSLPDIGTVLTASATALLRNSRVVDGGVYCEGVVQATVLYEPEGGGSICTVNVQVPYRCGTESAALSENARLYVVPKLQCIDVKVMNPRKIMVQAEVSLHILAFATKELHYSIGIESCSEQLETKRETERFRYISQVTEKRFPFEETINISSAHRQAEQFLSLEITSYCTEARIVGTKLIFKGGIKAKARFITTDGTLAAECYDLPVSQVLDAGASTENAFPVVQLSVTDVDTEFYDEDCISLKLELYACAIVFEHKEVSVLSDAYSTHLPCSCTCGEDSVLEQLDINTGTTPFRQALDVQIPAAEVIDESITLAEVVYGDEGVRCRLKVTASLKERDDRFTNIEQNCYVDIPIRRGESMQHVMEVQLLDGACLCAAGGMEVRGTLLVRSAVLKHGVLKYIQAINLDETSENFSDCRPSAVLRMLRPGETLWNLGKEYYSKVSDILEVNQISDEQGAQGKFLLIPRGR